MKFLSFMVGTTITKFQTRHETSCRSIHASTVLDRKYIVAVLQVCLSLLAAPSQSIRINSFS